MSWRLSSFLLFFCVSYLSSSFCSISSLIPQPCIYLGVFWKHLTHLFSAFSEASTSSLSLSFFVYFPRGWLQNTTTLDICLAVSCSCSCLFGLGRDLASSAAFSTSSSWITIFGYYLSNPPSLAQEVLYICYLSTNLYTHSNNYHYYYTQGKQGGEWEEGSKDHDQRDKGRWRNYWVGFGRSLA